ncbi:MAG: MotA/TolQ/ExbB proton channel family protein [Opitutales bacterium]
MIPDLLILPISAQGADPSVFQYFTQSNFAGKVIVVALVLFSLVAWTIMIGKYLELSRLRTLNSALEDHLLEQETVLRPQNLIKAEFPYNVLFRESLEAYFRCGPVAEGSSKQGPLRISHVENALQRSVARKSADYESRMVFLASIVTGAPFLGLLGTVWGVMDAFGAVALQSTATLQMLAPGVSGALLTTVAGLLVAIPSVFGYNILLTKTKTMITDLENFASSLADRIELEHNSGDEESPYSGRR